MQCLYIQRIGMQNMKLSWLTVFIVIFQPVAHVDGQLNLFPIFRVVPLFYGLKNDSCKLV